MFRKIIAITCIVLLPACSLFEDELNLRTREGAAPTEQQLNPDTFEVISPIPDDVVSTYKLDTNYYHKLITVWGVPVLGPENLDDTLLKNAAEIVALQLSDRVLNNDYSVQIRDKLFQHYFRIVIFTDGKGSKGVPEFSSYESVNGYGAIKELPLTGATEHSVDYEWDYESGDNRAAASGNSLIHEITHSIHDLAVGDIIEGFNDRLKESYSMAIKQGAWQDTRLQDANGSGYAATNADEYIAVGSELFHNVRYLHAKIEKPEDQSLHDHLYENDSSLYSLLTEIYNENYLLNPNAGIYKAHTELSCKINQSEYLELTGKEYFDASGVEFNITAEGEEYLVSRLSKADEREIVNGFLISAIPLSYSESFLSVKLPHQSHAPSYYLKDQFTARFSFEGEEVLTCSKDASELLD